MSGLKSRRKGYRVEREAVDLLQEVGLAAERVPLSGGAGGRWAGDIICPIYGVDRVLEVKCRANGFKTIYSYLAENYGLIVRADRMEPVICLRLEDFARLAIKADEARWKNEPMV